MKRLGSGVHVFFACIRAHRGHFEHRLSMFDICTNVHFDSHMSVWLPIVHTYVFGWLTKPAITIDRFYWNLAFCLQLDVALLLQNFAKIWHCQIWKCIQWFTFFQTQCSIVVYICSTLHLQYNIEYDSISDLKKDQTCFLDQSLVLGRGSPFSRSVSRDLTDVPPAQWPLPPSCSVGPLCFAPLLRTPTPPLAVQPDGIINTTSFDSCHPLSCGG